MPIAVLVVRQGALPVTGKKGMHRGAKKAMKGAKDRKLSLRTSLQSQTEIYPVQNWSLETPQEPSSRPQPQYWIKFLEPWAQAFYPVLGGSFATLIERAQLLPAPALDKNRSPRQEKRQNPELLPESFVIPFLSYIDASCKVASWRDVFPP